MAAGFDSLRSRFAKRAVLGIVSLHAQSFQGAVGRVEFHVSAAAVDDGGVADNVGAPAPQHGAHFLGGAAGGADVLADEDLLAREKSRPVIFFDKNDQLKGLEYIEPLHAAILDKKPGRMTYQSFRARIPNTFVFHPYALREFNNRWFIFGKRGKKDVENLALDRIVSLEEAPGVEYLDDPSFIPEEWFADMVGVTKFRNDSPERVVIWASPGDAPYIKTKPIHSSQRVLEVREDRSMVFELKVIVNRELVRLLFGFAEGIQVLRPRKLVYMMKKHFQLGAELYEKPDQEPDPTE